MSLVGRWLRWLYGLLIRKRQSRDPKRQQVIAFFNALQLRAWSHAVTVRIATISGDRERSFSTGSGVLIEFSNQRAVIATAWHVLEEFQSLRASGELVAIVVDNMPIELPRLLYSDIPRDIGCIELPTTGRSGITAVPYRPKLLWPPPRVEKGDDVLLCGFPKLLRVDREDILHGDLNLVLPVEASSEDVFYLQVDWGKMVQAGTVVIPPDTTSFGGVSGGPVYLVDAEGNPLVGLISQAGENLPLWRIAPLHFLPADLDTCQSVPL